MSISIPAPKILSIIPKIGSIEITWERPSIIGIRSYIIRYKEDTGTIWTSVTMSALSTSTIIRNLNSDKFYVFQILVRTSKNLSPYSEETIPVQPLSILPSSPTNVSLGFDLVRNSFNSIVVNWTPPSYRGASQIQQYKIEYSNNDGYSWNTISGLSGGSNNKLSYTINNLANNGITYSIRVSARNNEGWGLPSETKSMKLFAPPSAPTNFRLNKIVDKGAFVSWDLPTNNGGQNLTDYAIRCAGFKTLEEAQRYKPAPPENITPFEASRRRFDHTNTINNNFFVDNLTNGLYYALQIRAFNLKGNERYNRPGGSSVFSNTIIVVPSTVPSEPTNLQVEPSGDGQVAISWSAPTSNGGSDILDYIIEYYDGSKWVVYSDGYTANTSTTISGLNNGQSYIFKVAAVNIMGTGLFSVPSPAVVPGQIPPNAPTNLVGVSLNKAAALSWTAPINTGGLPILSYIVQQSSDGGNTWSLINNGISATTSGTNIIALNLNNDISYKFRVAATNAKGTGSYGSSITVIPSAKAPQAVRDFKSAAAPQSIVLSWVAPASDNGSPIISYTIQQSTNNGSTWTNTVSNLDPNSINYIVTNVELVTSYIFRIAAVNSIGTGPYTNSEPVTAEIPNKLFDNRTFNILVDMLIGTGEVPSSQAKWKAIMLEATTRLSKYLKYNDDIFTGVSNQVNAEMTRSDFRFPGPDYDYPYHPDAEYVVVEKNLGILGYLWNRITQTIDNPNGTASHNVADAVMWWILRNYAPVEADDEPLLFDGAFCNDLWIIMDTTSGMVAACGDIGRGYNYYAHPKDELEWILYPTTFTFGVNNFGIIINRYYENRFTHQNWVDIMTHELCHGLGIGTLWYATQLRCQVKPYLGIMNYLGLWWPRTQQAYNEITGLSVEMLRLEGGGGAGTAGSHWEDNAYLSRDPFCSEYARCGTTCFPEVPRLYGVWDELMIGWAPNPGERRVLSKLTIKNLVDIGYEEVNPGTSEGDPEVINPDAVSVQSIGSNKPNRIKLNCTHTNEL